MQNSSNIYLAMYQDYAPLEYCNKTNYYWSKVVYYFIIYHISSKTSGFRTFGRYHFANFLYKIMRKVCKRYYPYLHTAQKVYVFGGFLVRIFPHSDLIWRFTLYIIPNLRKCGPEKLRIRTVFTQCAIIKRETP